jgi:hypothetical protein
MDMREASAMTEASGLPSDQDAVENASGAMPSVSDAMRGAKARDARTPAVGFSDELRSLAREAPLLALSMAFLLGFLVARRR